MKRTKDQAPIPLTREAVYDLVWTVPIGELASRWEKSYTGLVQILADLEIPRPPNGYWSRARFQHIPRTPLLPLNGLKLATLQSCLDALAPPARNSAGEHDIIKWIRAAVKVPYYANGRSRNLNLLDVTQQQMPRALRILDSIFKAIESLGHQAQIDEKRPIHKSDVTLLAHGCSFAIEISENKDQREHRAEPGEHNPLKHDYTPSGRLTIRLVAYGRGRVCSWNDTRKRSLQARIPQIVADIERHARLGHMEAQQTIQQAAQRAEALRQQQLQDERIKRRLMYSNYLPRNLEEMAALWEKAQRIRSFLSAYEAAMTAQGKSVPLEWIEVCREYRDRLDPLSALDSVAKEIHPSDEALERWKL